MISLVNVVKAYDGKQKNTMAVDGLNLEIAKGEFVALLGPSGCGKTTTLMMLAGLLKPTSGEIYFNDRLVNHVEPRDRNIGMVFQSYALYPHLSVYENIAFPLRERKMSKNDIEQRVQSTSKILQIDHLLDRKPSQLSGGQQQRVAMARALSKDPEILLLDEPMSNLDARLKLDVRDEIRKIQRKLGVTTIIVTHDQEEALAISDRVAILNGGKIQQYASPNELFMHPKNLFVASFLGNPPMNLIEGVVKDRTGRQVVETAIGSYVLPESRQLAQEQLGKPVKLGVRPHDFKFVGEQAQADFELKIDLIEHIGSGKLVKLTDPKSETDLMIRVLVDNERNLREGESVFLKVEERKFHLFDMEHEGVNLMQFK